MYDYVYVYSVNISIVCFFMGIDVRFASSGYFRVISAADKFIVPQIRHIHVVCRSSFSVHPEAMNFLGHKMFNSGRKSLLTLVCKLRKWLRCWRVYVNILHILHPTIEDASS